VTESVLESRAATDAMSTSPLVTVVGRRTVIVEPNDVVVTTVPPNCASLNAG